MATPYITNWIRDIENKIDFWVTTYPARPLLFTITPLPATPVINPNILSHRITSCCPSPPMPLISFSHYPEPYYGNPDNSVIKSAVVLFYNPGGYSDIQVLGNMLPNSFHQKYLAHGSHYYHLSAAFDFCTGTVNRFIIPKTSQVNNLIGCMVMVPQNVQPLFMDMIPWHSNGFIGVDKIRFALPGTIVEARKRVLLPAIFNAENSLLTHYLNSLQNGRGKTVLLSVGANYSRHFLPALGFHDVTRLIPDNPPVSVVNGGGDILAFLPFKKVKVWKINTSEVIDSFDEMEITLQNREIFVINAWYSTGRTMNIPIDICPTIAHILNHI
jgi:hypothetical protein